MASRPLPPGRRGRGSRTASTLQLPEAKILHAPSASGAIETPPGPVSNTNPIERVKSQTQGGHATNHVTPSTLIPCSSELDDSTSTAPVPQEDVGHAPVTVTLAKAMSVRDKIAALNAGATALGVANDAMTAMEPPKATPPAAATTSLEKNEGFSVPVSGNAIVQEQVPSIATVESISPALHSASTSTPSAHEGHRAERPEVTPRKNGDVFTQPSQPTLPASSRAVQAKPMLADTAFHPAQLLLPISHIPLIPESMECIFDDEAVEMQKNIMKAVKKLTNKDRMKLEDFKINSRLLGNNFMEPYEYVEYLARDFGGIRALQLLPCLISIQPDFMKRNSMLVAARTYALRNKGALDRELAHAAASQSPTPNLCAQEQPSVEIQRDASKREPIPNATLPSTALTSSGHPESPTVGKSDIEVAVESTSMNPTFCDQVEHAEKTELVTATNYPQVEDDRTGQASSIAESSNSPSAESVGRYKSEGRDLKATSAASSPLHTSRVQLSKANSQSEERAHATAPPQVGVALVPAVENHGPVGCISTLLSTTDSKDIVIPVEASTASAAGSSGDTNSEAAVDEHRPESITAPQPPIASSTSPVNSHQSSSALNNSETGTRVVSPKSGVNMPHQKRLSINLFGEELVNEAESSSEETNPPVERANDATATSTPVATSFFEASTLFGEPLPAASMASALPSKASASERAPPIVKAHSAMLFGFGSVGTDSDSDEDSDFSD